MKGLELGSDLIPNPELYPYIALILRLGSALALLAAFLTCTPFRTHLDN